ncbi:MAG: PAS domain-containing protein, partial [Acidobacteriota bacterium]
MPAKVMQARKPIKKRLKTKLEQAEARLRDMEERYEHLVQGTHGLICTHDLAGILLTINPSACEALGYRCDEMVGRNLRDFLSPSRQPYFQIFLDR